MAAYLASLMETNGLTGWTVAEPFAGGAGASIALLYSGKASRLALNDADPAIRDFWLAALSDTDNFLRLLRDTPVTVDEWRRQRAVWERPEGHDLTTRGFATFYLNRVNRSGILRGRPIGGLEQTGAYPITARYNPARLTQRIARLAAWRGSISVSSLDALEFLEAVAKRPPFLFLDPPYVGQGRHLYMNSFRPEHHTRLADWLKSHPGLPWVLTYDDHPLIRELYAWARITPVSLRYSAQVKRFATELLILPPWMRVPIDPPSPLRYATPRQRHDPFLIPSQHGEVPLQNHSTIAVGGELLRRLVGLS
ncbi:MAG: DNA adenine methylase [Desulfovibrio sp.]|nr:DNA adenine methylase [Desulfovibrio sp.]